MGVGSRSGRSAAWLLAAGVLMFSACTSDATPPMPAVDPAEAYTAIVLWEVEQADPILDEDGEAMLPVVYLAASSGATVDVGVQASVVEATTDQAVVRFADDSTESIDDGLEGAPVKDAGTMFIVADFVEGAPIVAAEASRYRSIADNTSLVFEIIAADGSAKVVGAVSPDDAD